MMSACIYAMCPTSVLFTCVQPIKAEAGLKLGLVDALAPREKLLAEAKAYALDMANGRKPRMNSLARTDK